MTALANAKHERFAQLLFQGKPASAAYAEASYKPDDGNAARLTGNDKVQARLSELKVHSSIRAEITVASITDRLLKIAAIGESNPEDSKMLAVARASLMDAAKLNGLVVERSEVNANVRSMIADKPLTEAEWQTEAATLQ